jgi:LPXTG-site transpeptidase (sortase) family protein
MVSVMPADDHGQTARGGENKSPDSSNNNDAVELIRAKIKNLYFEEPNAKQEAAEAEAARPRSKHQQFMHTLSTSGKSLAQVQTEWHNYYINLPDDEKHEVWREFYSNHNKVFKPSSPVAATAPPRAEDQPAKEPDRHKDASDIRKHILNTVSKRSKLSVKRQHQLKSMMFGLGMGTLVLVVLMFGFFNERFIAPFITPSRTVSSTPIITDLTSTVKVSKNPVVIIPKINIEIPVVYDEESIDDKAVQRALERGVLHYPTTSNPGEEGNAAFFGHSSSNIFNNGRYKYAFVLLRKLEIGDTFMIQKGGKRYVYKVFEKQVVKPTEVSVLNPRDRPTATLITCDPPGSSANRLVVTGEQISPDPTRNIASSAPARGASPETLPSESPTLWGRLWGWLSS